LHYREGEASRSSLPLAMARSFWERAFLDQWAVVIQVVGRMAPAESRMRLQRRLDQAGGLHGAKPASYMAAQGLLSLVALVAALVLARPHVPPRLMLALVVGAPLMASMVPNWFVDRLAGARRRAIRSALRTPSTSWW